MKEAKEMKPSRLRGADRGGSDTKGNAMRLSEQSA